MEERKEAREGGREGGHSGRRTGAGRRPTDPPRLAPIALADGVSSERAIYAALKQAMMEGRIRPGQSLTSRSLSGALGVSPTPVREALKRLEADGALVARNKSAFVVNDPDQGELAELLEIRLGLEGLAIRKAASRATPADLGPLRALNDDYERLVAMQGAGLTQALAPNFAFHFEIYRLSGSPMLVALIRTLWLRVGPTLHRYLGGSDFELVTTAPHRDILAALAANDPDAAEAALRADLVHAFDAIVPQLPLRKGARETP